MGRIYIPGQSAGVFSTLNNRANTKLLIHSNTTNGSTTHIDSSLSAHTVSTQGDADHSTITKKWGTTGLRFPTSGSYLTIADHADFSVGSSAFTFDFWFYVAALPTTPARYGLFQHYQDATNYYGAELQSNGTFFFTQNNAGSVTTATSDASITALNWHHIAIVRGWDGTNNTLACCINGVATTTSFAGITINDYAGSFNIARFYNATAWEYFIGYMDEFRYVKGQAMWTNNFTPPSGPYR